MSLSENESSGKLKQIVVINESEDERLLRKINRSDMEKFLSFTKMLRTNNMYKLAKVTHK
ncbi:MAG: hypothetical protein H7289_10980 [Mucilaginibacter sp.]|nr:hypothetical protein [Mucilaginibacter sp.]